MLLLSTNCVIDSGDVMSACSYPSFIMKTSREFRLSSPFYCDIFMFIRAFNNEWLAVFLPILTGIASVPSLCDEINSNNFRVNISRTGFGKYIASKFVSAFITAVVMILLVCIIFGLFCIYFFPSPQEFFDSFESTDNDALAYYRHLTDFSDYPLNALLHSRSRFLAGLSRLATITLYSGLPCEIAMVFAAWTSNKFVSVSVPVMFYFGIEQIAISVVQKAIEESNTTPAVCFFDFHSRLYEGERYFSDIIGLPVFVFYLYPIMFIALAGIAFKFLLKRRVYS